MSEVLESTTDELQDVFVYGSLKRDFSNHHVMGDSTFIGVGRTEPKFAMIDLYAFPGVVAGQHAITGEVYRVNRRVMKNLDRLESNGSMYQRTRVPVTLHDGNVVSAWMYIYLHAHEGDDVIEPEDGAATWD